MLPEIISNITGHYFKHPDLGMRRLQRFNRGGKSYLAPWEWNTGEDVDSTDLRNALNYGTAYEVDPKTGDLIGDREPEQEQPVEPNPIFQPGPDVGFGVPIDQVFRIPGYPPSEYLRKTRRQRPEGVLFGDGGRGLLTDGNMTRDPATGRIYGDGAAYNPYGFLGSMRNMAPSAFWNIIQAILSGGRF